MIPPEWLWSLLMAVFLVGPGTLAQIQLDINDPGMFALLCLPGGLGYTGSSVVTNKVALPPHQ